MALMTWWRTAQSDDSLRPRQLLHWAIFIALLAGVIEAAYLLTALYLWNSWLPLSPQLVWLAPLVNLALLSPIALSLFVLTSARPRWLPVSIAAGILTVIGAAMVLLLVPSLHRFARLLIIAGVAFQATRAWQRHSVALQRITTRGAAVLAGLILVATLSLNAVRAVSDTLAAADRPGPRDGAPNVILFILDTVRARNLGMYGYARNTSPRLDELAQRSTIFQRAFAPSSWTLPSHATIFTGRYPERHGADWKRPLDNRYPTLAEVLRDNGYDTGGFVANLAYTSRQTGLDRGFLHYEDYPGSQFIRGSALARRIDREPRIRQLFGFHDTAYRKRATRVNRDFLAWLSDRDEPARPFFAFLNYMDAHEPYLPPDPFRQMFGSDSVRNNHLLKVNSPFGGVYRPWRNRLSPAEQQAELNGYDASIASIDHAFGELITELDQSGQLENTIIIVTSDHGEHLGEGGRFGHGSTLLMQVLHVPLLIYYPHTVPAGRSIAANVTLRDLPFTILDLAGFAQSSPLPGKSLASLWRVNGNGPTSTVVANLSAGVRTRPRVGMTAIIEGDVEYILRDDGREEVYNLKTDPFTLVDLANTPWGDRAADRLEYLLDSASSHESAGRSSASLHPGPDIRRNAVSDKLSWAPDAVDRRVQ